MLSKKKPQDKVDPEYLVGLDTASAQPAPAGVKPFIKKHWKPITAAICAAAVAAAVLVPKNSAKPAAANAQYVETRPEKLDIVNSYSADGTITAADTYTVKPMVKGTVLTADFEVGDTVNKGDVLYTIDSSDMASSVEKAQLSLEQAQSSYDDAVDAQYIHSSVRGTVSSLKVKAGDVISAGQEVAVVRDDSTLLLTLDFPAADAITYFVGQSVDVIIDGRSVATYAQKEIEKAGGKISYMIEGASEPQKIEAAALDMAGNETTSEMHKVLVTSSVWIQYINNTPLLIGSILGIVLVAGGLIWFFVIRKKKEESK